MIREIKTPIDSRAVYLIGDVELMDRYDLPFDDAVYKVLGTIIEKIDKILPKDPYNEGLLWGGEN